MSAVAGIAVGMMEQAALDYARQGWPVFPCHATGERAKSPLIARGLHAASLDEAQIRDWWRQWPNALIGRPTGPICGHWVLDIDVHNGSMGPQSLAAWESEHQALPPTLSVTTASGGRHLLFRWPDGSEVPSRVNIAPGIDTRGRGGYVISPPSVGAGGAWRWDQGGMDIAKAPAWLLERVCTPVSPRLSRVPPPEEGAESSFFARVNAKALLMLAAWVPSVFPQAKVYHEGYRVSSASLHRSLQEDISLLPAGIRDFGEEVGCTAIDIVLQWGPVATPSEAALWLCQRMGIEAQALGWRTKSTPMLHQEAPPPVEWGGEFSPAPPGKPHLRVVGGTASRPTIQIVNGEQPEAVDDAERFLIKAGIDIFQHGTRLVRVGRWEQSLESMTRPVGSGVLIDISPIWLADVLTRHVQFERFDARKNDMKRIDCPAKIATTLLERVGSWSFPGLIGFTDSPTLDLKGRLISQEGYDPQSGIYLSRPPAIAPIPRMDRYLAERYGEVLSEAVDTFPFVSPGDLSACLAMILTALLRRVLPSCPLACVTANTPATGKSKLVDVIAAIATGRTCPVTGLGATAEELEKRVDSLLLKGDLLASFDNVDRPVKSDVLCQVTTQREKTVRVMGLSKIVDAPTNILLFMTGNNLTLVGDLVRRCLVTHLDAGCERPELRTFTRDAVDYVLERRAELIHAALAISQGYQMAGCPDVGTLPFGSFEEWDRMIRRPLIWAGFADPLLPAQDMREQDHELAAMRDFLEAWKEAISHPVTAAELTQAIRANDPGMGGDWVPQHPGLRESAIQIMGDLSKWGARDLGYRLRSLAGRMFDGMRIVKLDKSMHGIRWRVQ